MRVLFFIPSLDYSGAAKQLVLLADGLPRERYTVRVCTLSGPTPWSDLLRTAGIEVETLARQRLFDVKPWRNLARITRDFMPDVVHVWGLPAVWLGLMLRRWSGGRLILNAWRAPRSREVELSILDRWAIRSQNYHLTVSGAAEAERWRRLGVPEDRMVMIPPAVATPERTTMTEGSARGLHGIPAGVRLLACVGPLEPHKGYYDALWGFDILKFLYDDLHLVLIGRGSDRVRLERFARAINVAEQVHFVGSLPEVRPILNEAELVWVPSRMPSGINAALEAMSAGRPVVAAEQLELAEIVADGETGYLYPPGDKATLARQTRTLLDDADRRGRMGDAGRQRVESVFTVEEMVRRYGSLYRHG